MQAWCRRFWHRAVSGEGSEAVDVRRLEAEGPHICKTKADEEDFDDQSSSACDKEVSKFVDEDGGPNRMAKTKMLKMKVSIFKSLCG
jgi:hypothetical protein